MSAQPSQYGAGGGKKAVHVKVSKSKHECELTYDPDEDRRHGDAFGHQLERVDQKGSLKVTRVTRTFCTGAIVPWRSVPLLRFFDLCSVGLFLVSFYGHGSINSRMTILNAVASAIFLEKATLWSCVL